MDATMIVSNSRALEMRSIIHERPVPLTRFLPRCRLLYKRYQLRISYCSLLQNTRIEMMDKYGADVGLEHRMRFVKCKRSYCGECIRADAGKRVRKRSPEVSSILAYYYFCCVVQIFRAAIVAETTPYF